MARVRMIALLLLAGCAQADAQPSAAERSPAIASDWEPLPAIATAIAAAATVDGIVVDTASAWGETARGCYGVMLVLHSGSSGASATSIADDIIASLSSDTAILVRDVVRSDDDAVLSLTFERGLFRGRLRTHVTGGEITAAACFANDRERAGCELACTGFLAAGAR